MFKKIIKNGEKKASIHMKPGFLHKRFILSYQSMDKRLVNTLPVLDIYWNVLCTMYIYTMVTTLNI